MRKILSLVISTAMLLASFTTYAQTETENFELLQALNIVEGYEDGSLKLDNDITRDEATKVIVTMINKGADAQATMGETKYPDATEWASGYINVATANDIIDGFEDGTFRPKDNVTYAQMVKMIMCAMGYGDYAKSLTDQYGYTRSNWYIPYITLADDADVTKDVYANPNDNITRGQVFKLVDNAINAPIVKTVGIGYTDSGKIVPKIQIQDGSESSVFYRSILTEKFDAYCIEGKVTATQKDNAGLKGNEINFTVEKTKRYDKEDIDTIGLLGKVNTGNTDAADYKGVYASAVVTFDENDNWTLLSFIPSKKNATVTFNLADVDKDDYSNNYLKFFVDDAKVSTKYILENPKTIYVNGVKVDSATVITDYIINNDIGEITLVDTYKTNGKFDTIYVNSYVSGIVDGVNSNGKITFKNDDLSAGSITLDDEDTSLEYNIYYNDEAITIDELQKDDVLTIAYDVTVDANQKIAFKNSKFYDIYVSRDIITDSLRGKNDEDYQAKFGDTYYTFANSLTYASFDANSELGNEYTVYLDAFGRIYKAEINSSSANWGVVTKFYLSVEDDDYKMVIYTADGASRTYYVDGKKVDTTVIALDTNIQNNVVKYKVSSSTGKIVDVDFVIPTISLTNKEEYKSRNNTIGSIKLGNITKIVDATEWSDKELNATNINNLVNENKYKAYAYGAKIDGIYPFVLITEGEAAYTAGTRFAVVTKDSYSEVIDETTGYILYEISAMYGDTEILLATDDVVGLENLKAADVIMFKTNENGYVTDYNVIFSLGDSIPDQATLTTNSLVANNTIYSNLTNITIETVFGNGTNFSDDFTTAWTGVSNDAIQLVYGPVIDKTDADVTFAAINSENKTNTLNADEAIVFDFADDINVYTYDYAMGKNNRFEYSASTSAIVSTNILESNTSNDVIDWGYEVDGVKVNQETVNFAFALVVDGEIVDIFEFIAE